MHLPYSCHTLFVSSIAMAKEFSVKFPSSISKLKEGDWLRWSHEISVALRAQRLGLHGWYRYCTQRCTGVVGVKTAHDQIVGALALLQCKLESINNAKISWQKTKRKNTF